MKTYACSITNGIEVSAIATHTLKNISIYRLEDLMYKIDDDRKVQVTTIPENITYAYVYKITIYNHHRKIESIW